MSDRPPNPQQVIDIAHGIEVSRRRGWAMFYKEREEKLKVLELNKLLMEHIAELCVLISEEEAVQVLAPDGNLARRACSILGSLSNRARGKAAIARVMARRRDAAA